MAAQRRRRIACAAVGLTLIVSVLLPHVALASEAGRNHSLLPSGIYFLNVQAITFGPGVDINLLGLGFGLTYLGLALHQFGFVLSMVSFWVLLGDDVNRWLARILSVGGWMLALSAPLVLTGWQRMTASGVTVVLGSAWLVTLVVGLAIILLGRQMRERVDYDWFAANPELQ